MRAFFYVLLLCLSGIAYASTHEYTLNNGLKIVVKEDHRAPVATVQVWYKIGSAYEPAGLTGISHMLEHLMFEGTKRYPAGQFSRLIAAQGGQENAFTSTDYTAYFQKLAADKIELSFKLEADRMQNLQFNPKRFAKELEVVKEERRMRVDDNPDALLVERLFATAHIANPYHHMTIGWMSDLQQLTLNDVKQWYQRWYAPNNATLVVVGDVNPKQIAALAKKYFGNIPRTLIPSPPHLPEPRPLGTRHVNIQVPAKLSSLIMAYNVPSIKTTKVKWHPYALDVLVNILNDGESARLTKRLVRDQNIATATDASYNAYALYSHLFTIEGVPNPPNTVADLQKALEKEIQTLQTELITTQELERIKTRVLASKVYSRDSLFGQAMIIGSLESIGLSWREYDNYVKQVHAITPEQVRAVAQHYLIPNRLTIATLTPLPINTGVTS